MVPCSKEARCKNFVDVEIPDSEGVFLPRVRHILRLEAMVSVGCTFLVTDLTPREWDELIAAAGERQRLDNEIQALRYERDRETTLPPEEAKAVTAARKDAGVPPPGQSLFK